MDKILNRPISWPEQAARFAAIGLLNTAVDLGLYLLLTRWLGFFAGLPTAAKALSYSAGLLNSFFMNRTFTFHQQDGGRGALPRFVAANLAGLALNAGALNLALAAGLPEAAALVLACSASLAWNFIASKFLVFNEPAKPRPTAR